MRIIIWRDSVVVLEGGDKKRKERERLGLVRQRRKKG